MSSIIRTAKVFRNGGSQAIRLPKDLRVTGDEVLLKQDFGERAAFYTGQIRAYLEPTGMSIGPLDTPIAAHAMSLEAVTVTDNVSEFSRVPGLRVENWLR